MQFCGSFLRSIPIAQAWALHPAWGHGHASPMEGALIVATAALVAAVVWMMVWLALLDLDDRRHSV
jgi:hypothetical protein